MKAYILFPITLIVALSTSVVALDPPYILSVTASGDFSKQNSMLAFSPTDLNKVLIQIPYPYYESTLAGVYDPTQHRYMLMVETGPEVNIYDALNLTKILSVPLSKISIQFPDAMHYDYVTDLIWLVYALPDTGVNYCALPPTSTGTGFKCYGPFSGNYSYTTDASAYDLKNKKIWTVLMEMQGGRSALLGFDTTTLTATTPIEINELCQDMQVVTLKNQSTLVCVRFVSNDLCSLNTDTGTFTKIYNFPPLSPPIYHSTTIRVATDGSTTSYYAELYGAVESTWVEIDIVTGTVLSNSSVSALQNLPLAMPVYVY